MTALSLFVLSLCQARFCRQHRRSVSHLCKCLPLTCTEEKFQNNNYYHRLLPKFIIIQRININRHPNINDNNNNFNNDAHEMHMTDAQLDAYMAYYSKIHLSIPPKYTEKKIHEHQLSSLFPCNQLYL